MGISTLRQRIRRVEAIQDRLKAAMVKPDLSPAKRAASERAMLIADKLIAQPKARQQASNQAYPSENLSPRRKRLWDSAQKALDDSSKTPQQKQAAQHVQDIIAAPYRKPQQQAGKP